MKINLPTKTTAFYWHFLQRKWFVIAFIVGTILNLINQSEALFGQSAIHYPKLLLTYCVPYLVSSISALYAKK